VAEYDDHSAEEEDVAVSKAHPDSRDRGNGFRIGDAFPADEPIARWATVLSIAANDSIYLNIRLIDGGLPPELNIYYFRLLAAHFFEAAEWLANTRNTWPEVEALSTPSMKTRRNALIA
jgi:hypothetical protein